MSDDLINDPEWQELLDGFRQHFWDCRVPHFHQTWSLMKQCPLRTDDGAALKTAVHGLAGVAALVNLETIGELARSIEQGWDGTIDEAHLRHQLQSLEDLLHAAHRDRNKRAKRAVNSPG